MRCGRSYSVESQTPRTFDDLTRITLGAEYRQPEFTAFFCNDCWKNEVQTHLLRASFAQGETRSEGLPFNFRVDRAVRVA